MVSYLWVERSDWTRKSNTEFSYFPSHYLLIFSFCIDHPRWLTVLVPLHLTPNISHHSCCSVSSSSTALIIFAIFLVNLSILIFRIYSAYLSILLKSICLISRQTLRSVPSTFSNSLGLLCICVVHIICILRRVCNTST